MASIRERITNGHERTWAVLYRHGGRQSSKTFATLKAAERFRSLVEALGPDRAIKELLTDERADRLTVDQLAAAFLDWKKRDVTARTMTDYRRDYGNWIKPWLGHRAAESVDETDVQKLVDHMALTLSPKSVADRHMLLHSMYEYGRAKSRRLVEHNPCLETDLPRRKKKRPKGTTVDEFARLLEAASKRNPDAHDLILFLGETGWRWSEGAALAVSEVDDNGADVWVTVSQVFRLDGSYRQVIAPDEAKSVAAFRRIRMFPATAAMLRRRLIGLGPGDLVFTNSRGRPWNQNTFLRDTWPKLLADAGLPTEPRNRPTPHWLRHMHVAVLSAARVPMQEIQRRVGHEHYSTTVDVYGTMIGDVSDDALARSADIMAGRRSAPSVAEIAAAGSVVVGELA